MKRLREQDAKGAHPLAVTKERFRRIGSHVAAPLPDEGINIAAHEEDGPH
jgi:hypothetical protein